MDTAASDPSTPEALLRLLEERAGEGDTVDVMIKVLALKIVTHAADKVPSQLVEMTKGAEDPGRSAREATQAFMWHQLKGYERNISAERQVGRAIEEALSKWCKDNLYPEATESSELESSE